MARKKFTLPSLDLSKYTDPNNLPVNVEKIIIEALIYFKMDIEKVCNHFSLNDELVNSVAIKYYSQISGALENKLKMSEVDDSINDICSIFKKHISEIKKAQNKAENKSLRNSELTNLCKVSDRLKEVRKTGTEIYKTTITDLANSILNIKTTELRINGPIEDNSDYNENQTTVYDMLAGFKNSSRDSVKKPVLLIDSKTNEVKEYESLKAIATDLNTTTDYIRKKIDKKTLYKGKYFIKFKKGSDNV